MSKRELRLLLGLGLVLLVFMFYTFFFTRSEEKQASLRVEQEQAQMQLDAIQAKVDQLPKFLNNIEKGNDLIAELSQHYYGELYQEALLVLIDKLAVDHEFMIKGINFTYINMNMEDVITNLLYSEEDKETFRASMPDVSESTIEMLTMTINYQASYQALSQFLESLYYHDKHIVIKDVNVQSSDLSMLSGVMTLEVPGLPTLVNEINQLPFEAFDEWSSRMSENEVFSPYATFVVPQVDLPETPSGQTDLTESDLIGSTEQTLLISSFEVLNYIFVPMQPAFGTAKRTTASRDGQYGIEIDYNFVETSDDNRVNLVFEEQSLYVDQYGQMLRIDAYVEAPFDHQLMAVLIDSNQKKYEVEFSDLAQPLEWQALYAAIPQEISYPFVIHRLVVGGQGEDQKLTGKIVLDNLRMTLPLD